MPAGEDKKIPKNGFLGTKLWKNNSKIHKAICSECEEKCALSFKSTDGKPVLCSNCF